MSFARLQSMSWTWAAADGSLRPMAFDEVALTRRQHTDKYRAEEVTDTKAVPVLRAYLKGVRVTRPCFDATPDSSDDELFAELPVHPVFRPTPMV